MVRFSDIIKVKDKKRKKVQAPSKEVVEDKFRLSDSMMFKKETKEEKDSSEETSKPDDATLELVSYYEKFIERAIEVKERVKNDQGISPSPIFSDLHSIINKALIDSLYEYAMCATSDYEDMLLQTIDVTFTSLKIGKGMEYDIKMLLRLGLAAFFENVGMYKIPDSILNRSGKLAEDEIKLIRRHPEISSEILSKMGDKYSWLSEVAIQIHERADGSGYPLGLKGDQISELASIIGLVDVYVAMIKKRPYRAKLMQTDAIKSILEASKGLFPSRIVKIFLAQISLFPVNSYVKLNNSSIGRVISTDQNQPLRPTIELVYNGLGKKVQKRQVIHLSDNPLLYIERSISEDDLQ
jgi:HD-GYP domain-containing protein (c-di-GMP phosphodiesterase class II)